MSDLPNVHPVDRLADLRERIAELQAEEKDLRERIINGECGPVGDRYQAAVSESAMETVDRKALLARFGRSELEPFLRSHTVRRVTIRRRGREKLPRRRAIVLLQDN